METPKKTFETSDIDLGAFLISHGLRYIDSKVEYDENKRRPKAVLRFEDDKQNARDLERVFLGSPEKRYIDLRKYLLKEIHGKINDFSKKVIEGQED